MRRERNDVHLEPDGHLIELREKVLQKEKSDYFHLCEARNRLHYSEMKSPPLIDYRC